MALQYTEADLHNWLQRFSWFNGDPTEILDKERYGGNFPKSLKEFKVASPFVKDIFTQFLKGNGAQSDLISAVEDFLKNRSAKATIENSTVKKDAESRVGMLRNEYNELKAAFPREHRSSLSKAYWGNKSEGNLQKLVRERLNATNNIKQALNEALAAINGAHDLGWPDKYAVPSLGLDVEDVINAIGACVITLGESEGTLRTYSNLKSVITSPDEDKKIYAALAGHDRACLSVAQAMQNIADLWYEWAKGTAQKNYIKNIETNDPDYYAKTKALAITLSKIGGMLIFAGKIAPPLIIVGGALAGVSLGVGEGLDYRKMKEEVQSPEQIAEFLVQDEFDEERGYRLDRNIAKKEAKNAERSEKRQNDPWAIAYIKGTVGDPLVDTAPSKLKDAGQAILDNGGTAIKVIEKGAEYLGAAALTAVQVTEQQVGLQGVSLVVDAVKVAKEGGAPKKFQVDPKRYRSALRFIRWRRTGVQNQTQSLQGFDVIREKALVMYEGWTDEWDNEPYYVPGFADSEKLPNGVTIRRMPMIYLGSELIGTPGDNLFSCQAYCMVGVEYWSEHNQTWEELDASPFEIAKTNTPITISMEGIISYDPDDVKIGNLSKFACPYYLALNPQYFTKGEKLFLDVDNHPYGDWVTQNDETEQGPRTLTGLTVPPAYASDLAKATAWVSAFNEYWQEKWSNTGREYNDERT